MEATAASGPHFAAAAILVDALADQDFAHLADAFDADATLSAMPPRGPVEWHGACAIGQAFERWFGDVDEFDVTDVTVTDIGPLLSMRWRLRVRGARLGESAMVVEQHAYAATGQTGRIGRMSLVCSGFWEDRHYLRLGPGPATTCS